MKILILANVPLSNNGIVNVIKNYCEHIVSHSCVEFQFCFSNIKNEELKDQFETNIGHVVDLGNRRKNYFHYCMMLKRYLCQEQFDIIHIHCNSHLVLPKLIIAKLSGCSTVMVHSHSTTSISPFMHKLLYFPFTKLYTHAFACGHEAGKWMFGNRSFTVINNSVDTEKFRFCQQERRKQRRELQYTEQDKIICHIGNFNPEKNHKFLLDVFEAIHTIDANYKLLLIGSGQLMDEVKSIVAKKQLNECVCFLGNCSRVSQYINVADVFVMPSLFEGLPLSLIEAQANGLKCIVSGAITEEVDKTGNVTFMSLQAPINEWINAIVSQDLTNREAISNAAIEKIKEAGYSIKDEANKLLKIYNDCL